MKNWFNLPKIWWRGLFILFLIYSAFYLIFVEQKIFNEDDEQIIRHIIRFGTTLMVYLTGTFHLKYIPTKWMQQLWHFIHISLFGTLLLFGAIKWLTPYYHISMTYWGTVFQEILISPTLYIGMGLLNKIYKY